MGTAGVFGQVRGPAALAVEATFNWYYFLNVVEPLGLELHLVHAWKTRAIASARIKHDRLDSRVLAELLRTGFLAETWIAPRGLREERQLLRYRVHTVQWATRAKDSIHGALNRNGSTSSKDSKDAPEYNLACAVTRKTRDLKLEGSGYPLLRWRLIGNSSMITFFLRLVADRCRHQEVASGL